MPASCQFKFTRMTPIYYGGDQLNGSVYLSTSSPLPLEAIELILTGTEQVQWCEWSRYPMVEHNDSSTTPNRVSFEGSQVLVNDRRNLAGNVVLEPGKLRIEKFCFQLPEVLPATLRHQFGEVTYNLNLILHHKSTRNTFFKERILVRKRLDLNERPQCNVPRSITSNHVKLSLLSTGFVPSQGIAYHLEHLDTAPECNKVQLNLCCCYSFRSMQPHPKTKAIEKLIASNTEKVVCSTVTGVMHIPLTTPISSTDELTLIEVSYSFEAVLYARRRILQKLVIPIVIGTVRPTSNDSRNSISRSDGPYCYDNFASTAVSCTSLSRASAASVLAAGKQQQLRDYMAHMMPPHCGNVLNEDIELSLFKRMEDCDRKYLLFMPKSAY